MKPTIEYSDFEKIEFRVGKVVLVTAPEWSHKLLEFTVDFGAEIGTKTVFSGVKAWYSEEDFLNKNFIFVLNLAERKMGEGVSQGMMIMADSEPQPVLCPVASEIAVGTVVR